MLFLSSILDYQQVQEMNPARIPLKTLLGYDLPLLPQADPVSSHRASISDWPRWTPPFRNLCLMLQTGKKYTFLTDFAGVTTPRTTTLQIHWFNSEASS